MRYGLVLALTACNQLYGIDSTNLDPTMDRDGDGVTDVLDNCLDVANPTQADPDGDGLGNECDNCPLVGNGDQANTGDVDGVGDACDPHPKTTGDCLFLLDGFGSPELFEQHWRTFRAPGDTTSRATADAGFVTLEPRDETTRFGIAPLADDGTPIAGTFFIQAGGHAAIRVLDEEVSIVSNAVDTVSGYSCAFGLSDPEDYAAYCVRPVPGASASCIFTAATAVPIGDAFLLRFGSSSSGMLLPTTCRLDHGYAVAGARMDAPPVLSTGGPAMIVQGARARLDAFVVYQFTLNNRDCPTPIVR